jgi:outer membrane protein OmpA-like peptidoglycan-associated protein
MGVSVATRLNAPQRANPQRSSTPLASRVPHSAAPPIQRLQRAVGNRATNRLLHSRTIQPKLSVSEPGDEYEREADHVADQVMRMPEPQTNVAPRHVQPNIQRACVECEDQLKRQSLTKGLGQGACKDCEEDESGVEMAKDRRRLMIQTKPLDSGAAPIAAPDPVALTTLNGEGRPLPASTRFFFERRMGHDFGAIRIHTGARANQLAKSVKARAFTHSNHLVFREGEYQPDTSPGRHLLAHELTHTIQQRASSPAGQHASTAQRSPEIQACDDAAAPQIQRVCEVTPAPAGLGCQEATSSAGTGTNISFGLDSSAISAADQSRLSAIAAAWHAGGGVAIIRIDGFASCDGAAANNWRLSCRRAQAVALELEAPSDRSPGIPNSNLEVNANGETDQFSPTTLAPNRRVVITSGGAPPPGPTCGLTITGPDEVDHYCSAYVVPNDAVTCGVFPAPNITLSVGGAAAGATLRWSITRGATKASIVGRNDTPSVAIKGDAPSISQGDVTVQLTDGTCTTTHAVTVREPTSMPAATAASSGPSFVQLLVTYTVSDQFGNPMGSNICWDETVTTCANSHPGGAHAKGDVGTDANGRVVDRLRVGGATGTLPASMCMKFNQTITVGGCGPLARNTIVFQNSGATLNQGSSCVAGDPCP